MPPDKRAKAGKIVESLGQRMGPHQKYRPIRGQEVLGSSWNSTHYISPICFSNFTWGEKVRNLS